MVLSPSTLFHFTNSLDVLFKILEEGFWPKYSKEAGWKYKTTEPSASFAVPMVSFCNIPLSQIHAHINYYGNYGIGVSKEWAMSSEKVIQPVLYITRNMIPILQRIAGKKKNISEDENAEYLQRFRMFLPLIKPYCDWNRGKGNNEIINDYMYYDEREWRYIPFEISDKNSCIWLRNKTINLEELNESTKTLKLKLQISAIKYIIIKSEEERVVTIEQIEHIFKSEVSAQDLSLLKSKILTCEQIEGDF